MTTAAYGPCWSGCGSLTPAGPGDPSVPRRALAAHPDYDSIATTGGQATESAAQVYERFVPPVQPVARAGAADRGGGQRDAGRAPDVACGTGVVARAALAQVVGGSGHRSRRESGRCSDVAGEGSGRHLGARGRPGDALRGRRLRRRREPVRVDVLRRPERGALDEMSRVARPGAPVAVLTWAGLDSTPGYAAMVALLEKCLFGPERADALRAPFVLGTSEAAPGRRSHRTSRTWRCTGRGQGTVRLDRRLGPHRHPAGRSPSRSPTRSTPRSGAGHGTICPASSATTARWTSPRRRCSPSAEPARPAAAPRIE